MYLNLCLCLNCIGGEWPRLCTIYIGRVLLPSTGKNTLPASIHYLHTSTQSTKELFCSSIRTQLFAQNPSRICTQVFALTQEYGIALNHNLLKLNVQNLRDCKNIKYFCAATSCPRTPTYKDKRPSICVKVYHKVLFGIMFKFLACNLYIQ